MKIGIVGLPNVGKSALFNVLTGISVKSENYPFCTIEPNISVVEVPDKRLDNLANIYNTKKIVHSVVEFVDIAGLIKGASSGEGLGNKFLSNIRESAAIVHVVRCFENSDVIHVEGRVDPVADIEIVNFELILSDIDTVNKKIKKIKNSLKASKIYEEELDFWNRILAHLEAGNLAKVFVYTKKEKEFLSTLQLLTNKPVIYVLNVDESLFLENLNDNKYFKSVRSLIKSEDSQILPICVELESQIACLNLEERISFLKELNIKNVSLENFIKASYKLLNLISFLTAGPKEVRSWTITKGTTAKKAAGKIHSDIEKGFIMAEVIKYEDLVEYKSTSVIRSNGLLNLEGKDYIVKDGDVMFFKFNV